MNRFALVILLGVVHIVAIDKPLLAQESFAIHPAEIRRTIDRSIPLIEKASAETAEQRKCFTCHGQALPVVALIEAHELGFRIDQANLKRQLDHTYAHLERSKDKYSDGSGTGGQVDTAGWALWALEADDREANDVTDAVVSYLLQKQKDNGVWRCTSNRPPTEASDFATSYLALRALDWFGRDAAEPKSEAAKERSLKWFQKAKPIDTEDRVFQLLSLPYLGLEERSDELIQSLNREQHDDGGWSQLPDSDSDPYATATTLYALAQSGFDTRDPHYQRGVKYLIENQNEDGSWYVQSRSKPFQTYFETGFPHGKDQFISTYATCWAVIAILEAMPDQAGD